MFVTDEAIKKLVEQFGTPQRAEFLLPVGLEEFEMIRSSQKHDRSHDVTLYIFKGDKVVVHARVENTN